MPSLLDYRTAADGTSQPIMPGWPWDRPKYTSLAAAAQGEASRWNLPGIAVAVLLPDGSIETTSAGFANLATRAPMTDNTISQIGSISKVFTTTLIMMLVDEGLLDLDTPVVRWMPDLSLADTRARDRITLRHLLSHTAGFEGDRFIDYGVGDDALAKAIAEYGSLTQWTQPGDLWSYCNAGFYLASRLVEVVTGQVFEDVFRERLVEPLGLATTFFSAEDVIAHPHAIGHTISDRNVGHVVSSHYSLPRHVNGCGGVVCSTRELLRFAQLHMGLGTIDGTTLVSEANATAMQQPETEAGDYYRHYGLGWCVHTYPEFRTFSHGGATNGFRAHLTVVPDSGFAISILTNGDAGSRVIPEVENWALKHYLQIERPTQPVVHHSPKHLAAFAGVYDRHDSTFTVTVEGDRLDLAGEFRDEETGAVELTASWPLLPVDDHFFVIPDGLARGMRVDFLVYEGNGSTEYLMRRGSRLSRRIGDAPVTRETTRKKANAKVKSTISAAKPRKKKKAISK